MQTVPSGPHQGRSGGVAVGGHGDAVVAQGPSRGADGVGEHGIGLLQRRTAAPRDRLQDLRPADLGPNDHQLGSGGGRF